MRAVVLLIASVLIVLVGVAAGVRWLVSQSAGTSPSASVQASQVRSAGWSTAARARVR